MCDNCNTNSCNCSYDPCDPCVSQVPVNIVQQAVNDALADRMPEMEGYVDDAAASAAAAKVSEDNAKESKDATQVLHDSTQGIFNDAQALVPVIADTSTTLQETAELVNEIANNVATYMVINYFYTAIGGESTIVIPADKPVAAVQAIYIEGERQDAGYGFVYDTVTRTITLAEPIPVEAAGTVLTIQLGQTSTDSPESVLSAMATGTGAGLVGTSTGGTVQSDLDKINQTNDDQQKAIDAVPGEISTAVGAYKADLANTSDTAKGDALIGVKLDAAGSVARTQHSKNADTLNVLDFGVVPNSTADQSASILQAIAAAAGRTLIFPKGTFIASLGILSAAVSLVGQGHANTIIKRPNSSPTGIVSLTGNVSYELKGICFDGNKANNTVAADNLKVSSDCAKFTATDCRSTNALGANGFTLGDQSATRTSVGVHGITRCCFDNNGNFGLRVTKINSVTIRDSEAYANADNGCMVDNTVFPPELKTQERIILSGNRWHSNKSAGLFISGFTQGGTAAYPLYGNGTHTNFNIMVSDEMIYSNERYGLAVQGNCVSLNNIQSYDNGVYGSTYAAAYAGVLVNATVAVVTNVIARNNSGYGFDFGGTTYLTQTGCLALQNGSQTGGGFVGMNYGAVQYGLISNNVSALNGPDSYGTQFLIPGYDGGNTSFPTLTVDLHFSSNLAVLGYASNRIGFRVYGHALNVSLESNKSTGGNVNRAVCIETSDSIVSLGHIHDDDATSMTMPVIAFAAAIVIPDYMETARIHGGGTITNILSYSESIFRNKVTETYVTAAGAGYDPANPPAVTFSGGGGTGAKATVALDAVGKVISVNIADDGYGSGYTSVPTLTIAAPPAGGTQATAVPRVGVKNYQGKKITLHFDTATTISSTNNIQLPGTTTSLAVPVNGVVNFMGTDSGTWILTGKSF